MNELSLFSGAGGGLLGTHHLLGWKCCGYVEWNGYCQQVIAARIRDGYLPAAPIFTDVREFVQSGAAREYRGVADVVSAGFPCQPFSVAGKQLGADDPRDMWPATLDVIRAVRPDYVLLENVPSLLALGYGAVVISGLAGLGYVGRWGCVGAAEAGADHLRARWWVVAHSAMLKCIHQSERDEHKAKRMPNNSSAWREDRSFDEATSKLCRVADGLADRVESARVCGNGQVPAVVKRAWELLS